MSEIGTIVRDRVWVSGAGGLSALSLDTGEVLATLPTDSSVITNTVDQLVLTISNDGNVVAYTPAK